MEAFEFDRASRDGGRERGGYTQRYGRDFSLPSSVAVADCTAVVFLRCIGPMISLSAATEARPADDGKTN